MNEVVNKLKGRLGLIVLAVAVVIIVSGFYIYQHYRNTHISTDDSYVTGRIHLVAYWNAANQSAQLLSLQGMDPVTAQQGGAGVIHNELLRQAYMLSFNDVFFVLTIMMICMLPFILFMRHVDHSAVKP